MILLRRQITFSLVLFALCTASSLASAGKPEQGQKIQEKVQELQRQMSQVSEIPRIMEKFEPLIKAQNYDEAEKVVDAALLKLKEFKASK